MRASEPAKQKQWLLGIWAQTPEFSWIWGENPVFFDARKRNLTVDFLKQLSILFQNPFLYFAFTWSFEPSPHPPTPPPPSPWNMFSKENACFWIKTDRTARFVARSFLHCQREYVVKANPHEHWHFRDPYTPDWRRCWLQRWRLYGC